MAGPPFSPMSRPDRYDGCVEAAAALRAAGWPADAAIRAAVRLDDCAICLEAACARHAPRPRRRRRSALIWVVGGAIIGLFLSSHDD